jgi:hypothetical protein
LYSRTRNILIVVIVCGLILGGALYWETQGWSPTCGPCWSSSNPPGCPVTPCPGHEALNVETSQVNSPTNVTLNIRNTGSVVLSLVSYSVKDSLSNQFTKTNWTTPYMNPNQLTAINIVIDGSAFTFQHGYSYTITVTSARNNLFTFTLTA